MKKHLFIVNTPTYCSNCQQSNYTYQTIEAKAPKLSACAMILFIFGALMFFPALRNIDFNNRIFLLKGITASTIFLIAAVLKLIQICIEEKPYFARVCKNCGTILFKQKSPYLIEQR